MSRATTLLFDDRLSPTFRPSRKRQREAAAAATGDAIDEQLASHARAAAPAPHNGESDMLEHGS